MEAPLSPGFQEKGFLLLWCHPLPQRLCLWSQSLGWEHPCPPLSVSPSLALGPAFSGPVTDLWDELCYLGPS